MRTYIFRDTRYNALLIIKDVYTRDTCVYYFVITDATSISIPINHHSRCLPDTSPDTLASPELAIQKKQSYNTSTSSQECENDENMDDLLFTDVQQVLRPNNSHNISRKDFCNSTPIKTTNSSATTSIPHNETEEMIETQSVHSETSSASGLQLTSGKGSKRKKVKPNENTSEAFWTNINAALKDINKDDQEQEDAGLHYWVLFLKSEMQCIKDRRRLRRLQVDILNLVREEQDADSVVQK